MTPLQALKELFQIILQRVPVPLRIWMISLVSVNLFSLVFIGTLQGKAVLIAALSGLVVMLALYASLGYVRLLGIGHIF